MAAFLPPRGMRDFYPEEYRLRETIFTAWRDAARTHGFESYDAPVVESMELLERKAGEEISEQIYTFQDKSGRRLALRGELTPSLARMINARQRELAFPLKWSAIVQCFRYERMTRGRKREHYQWNLDIVGEESVMAEAEVICTAVDALQRLGFSCSDLQVRVGSRALLGELFALCGLVPEQYSACFLVLDKRGKIADEEIASLLADAGISKSRIGPILDMTSIRTLEEAQSRAGASSRAISDLRELFTVAEPMGFRDDLVFDISIVRGLGYYTGIVFEAFDTGRKLRAVFGGGRYDNLLSLLGGDRMPCVGLGFGDVVVAELLAECGKTPRTSPRVDCAVGFMDAASRDIAMRVAACARQSGRECDTTLAPEKAKVFFKRANRIGAQHAIFIGPDEAATGRIHVKNMATGVQVECSIEGLAASLSAGKDQDTDSTDGHQ
ncbi:MAG: histidine--tRNA ligase [Candidatus Sumerlaeota bacterium]|nr:histidine--tRNA ligase [Candidatus Sumerlaeota bacterium]